ncbi:MAG: 16S rRNA (uracil(1498)-N(3))-methyltransferase [Microbacterium sp. SCN 70-200]|uniref:16S rRNA (uracil(1498)-N(3))-methyltransferase n=1 Tax=unclassified Microbacterium TaxID=2609290 RepID=UPI00086D3B38|nr:MULTISPECIES: 16S rRNA (uracil(1498)-N(3))-methyltransferase [unclassified Microbacterium]MBN9214623.1 16S rRNA (uracil(1498)-N(3))-methyltransferase [Microbacterium sp.]ODT41510.1 MAG: 16S rRNA (uracil(1498)-N(3))-methyltransferase [Microbacterium sp. SCN 70-200]OJV84008.1 MAG: 16S rRNA (uracil(1498)-N(3))-methyltransferase [Microbacterium sp. 70-16]
MALHFLVDEAEVAVRGARPGDVVELTGAEAHHAAVVRRVRVDEEVTVGDGRGTWLTGVVTEAAPRRVAVRVAAHETRPEASPRFVLVQALAKGDRDELAVQAATELGVDRIVPWQAARSVSRWDAAKAQKGVARWQTIVREAAKQAHRAWVPEVTAPVRTRELAALSDARLLVLEPTASVALSSIEQDAGDTRDLVLIVGPEGGIAPEELTALEASGAELVRLGGTVLRTSTAGPAALALLNARLGRW